MKSTIKLSILSLTLLLCLVLLVGCQSKPTESAVLVSETEALAQASGDSSLTVEGRLVPRAEINLAFALPGQVGQVLVQEGQVVQAGQVVAVLDTTEASLSVKQAETDLAAAQVRFELVQSTEPSKRQADISAATLALLQAQDALDDLEQNAKLKTAQVQLAIATAQKALNEAERTRTNMNYPRANQSTIDGAKAFYEIKVDELEKAQGDYDRVKHLPADNIERAKALVDLRDAQNERDRALATLNWYLGANKEEDIAEADAQLALAQAQLETARLQLAELQGGPSAKELALANEKIANAQALLELANAQSVEQQVALAKAQVDAAQTRLDLAKAQLDKLALKAPFAGEITTLNVQPGEWIITGQPAVVLADFAALLVKTTNLTEIDVVQVSLGQAVQVTVDALPGVEILGTVEAISKAYQDVRGDITYEVRIRLEETDPRLRWGMTVLVSFEKP
jgi:multidrug resistance efflux pump